MTRIMEDSFIGKMKSNFQAGLGKGDTLILGNTRHNLLEDFEDTPIKPSHSTSQGRSTKPSSAAKRPLSNISGYDEEESSALKKKAPLLTSEIASLKADLIKSQMQTASLETARRCDRIEFDKEVAKIKDDKDREAKKCSELRSKLQYVMSKEKNARDELLKLEDLRSHNKVIEQKLLALQREQLTAADKAQQAEARWLDTECVLNGQIRSQLCELTELQEKFETTKGQLKLMEKLKEEKAEQQKVVEELMTALKEAKHTSQNLEHQLSEHEDNLAFTKALKSDLDLVPAMKSELEKLRLDNEHLRYNEQNTLLLEEEVRSLKKKLEMAETVQEKVTQLEADNEELQGRLQRWEVTDTSGSRRPQSPSSLSRKVQDLQVSQANLLLAQGEMQTKVNSSQRLLNQAEREKASVKAELVAERENTTQLNNTIKRLNRRLLLISKERDSYHSLLSSYESEVTLNLDTERKSQLQQLEEVIEGYKEQRSNYEEEIKSLARQLQQVRGEVVKLQAVSHTTQTASSGEDQETIRQLREQLAAIENTLLTTQEEKDVLEARIEQRHLQGDYDPSKTKIIHLKVNPCSLAQQARQEEMDKLQEDNERLRKRNQILEEEGGPVEGLTVQVEDKLQQPSPSKQIEDMKAQLKSQELRNQRLQEVFKKLSQAFREVVYQLTGYKIDNPCANQYRLTSMYAESSRDYLLFQQNEQGEIQLLQTDFSNTLQETMELYLQQQNSIPMFLSHITMDLFSKQTMLMA